MLDYNTNQSGRQERELPVFGTNMDKLKIGASKCVISAPKAGEAHIGRHLAQYATFLPSHPSGHRHSLACGARWEYNACSEVRLLIDTFDRPEGGMCIVAGKGIVVSNGMVAGTPLNSVAAFLDEAVHYGMEHRRRFAQQRVWSFLWPPPGLAGVNGW